MSENILSLRYKEPDWIEGPSKVGLVEYADPEKFGYAGGVLEWCHDPNGHEETRPGHSFTSKTGEEIHFPESPGTEVYLAKRPTDGCLTEFIGLAEASPDDVAAFAQSRGVLGILPFVQTEWSDDPIWADWVGPTFHYAEAVFIYQELARQFGSILRVMQSLKIGAPVAEGDFRGCFVGRNIGMSERESYCHDQDREKYLNEPGFFPRKNYSFLSHMVSLLWQSATTTLGITQVDATPAGLGLSGPPVFELGYGRWNDGEAWDYQHDKIMHSGGLVAARKADLDAAQYGKEGSYEERMAACGCWKTDRGEWVKHYVSFVLDHLGSGHSEYRPSPLFNTLVFQLQKAITLPTDTYFCSYCNKPYQFDPDSPTRGSSKPRQDRETAFCGEFCRNAYKRDFDRQRYLKRRAVRASPS